MIMLDEDALICDLAQYYHIYDYEQLPVDTVAVLASGLPMDSRIKMKLMGWKWPFETQIIAGICDRLTMWMYSHTKDAKKQINKPKLILDSMRADDSKKQKVKSYRTEEEYESERKRILEKIKNG